MLEINFHLLQGSSLELIDISLKQLQNQYTAVTEARDLMNARLKMT